LFPDCGRATEKNFWGVSTNEGGWDGEFFFLSSRAGTGNFQKNSNSPTLGDGVHSYRAVTGSLQKQLIFFILNFQKKGYNQIYSSIQLFCTKTLFINSITCSAIFIELQEINYLFTNSEFVNLLALLKNTSNFIYFRRKKQLNNLNIFPVNYFFN